MKPTLSIILPTLGRDSLKRTLETIPSLPEVEVVLIGDGINETLLPISQHHERVVVARHPRSGDCGYSARNLGLVAATGEWVTFIDDDDYYAPEGVNRILAYCQSARYGLPAVFKMMRMSFNDCLWHKPQLVLGNQGLQQFVCRNRPEHPRFGTFYTADFNFMQMVVCMAGECNFREELTVVMPMQHQGK